MQMPIRRELPARGKRSESPVASHAFALLQIGFGKVFVVGKQTMHAVVSFKQTCDASLSSTSRGLEERWIAANGA